MRTVPTRNIASMVKAVLAACVLSACPGIGAQQAPPATPVPDGTDAIVAEGTSAPTTTATGPKDKPVSVADFHGKLLVLYFYPTDFAAGATAEAEEFRDDFAKYKKLGAVIVGVSTD